MKTSFSYHNAGNKDYNPFPVSEYREARRKIAVMKHKELLRLYGGGIYQGKKRNFVLTNGMLNLWYKIRKETIDYFERYDIGWWDSDNGPTGHLLSSQIQCLNILFPIRKDKDAVLRILQNIDSDFIDTEIIDEGYIEFEYIGEKNYLKEKSHQRGKYSTSIDAVIIGINKSGKKTLVAIEWKYTEFYKDAKNVLDEIYKGVTRRNTYYPILESNESPVLCSEFRDLFYEPFYQLMRQTLLAREIATKKEKNISDYLHLHIIPKENHDLINEITSPGLSGKTLSDAWKNVLKEPEKYRDIDTKEFIKPIFDTGEYAELKRYLDYRYFN